jgi:hypothetical protein
MYPIPEPWRGHCSQYRPHAKPREQQHFFAVMGIMRGREHCPKTKCWVETPYTALYKIIWNIQYLFVTITINQTRTMVSSGLNIRKCLLTSSTYSELVPAIRFKLFKIFSSHSNSEQYYGTLSVADMEHVEPLGISCWILGFHKA